jgi:hypothetical protein
VTIANGRKIKVSGETYVWVLSRPRNHGLTANFTAQHGSRGSVLTAKLRSKLWTPEMLHDDYAREGHKPSFTPADAKKAIEDAIARGWKPQEKGKIYELIDWSGIDYRTER